MAVPVWAAAILASAGSQAVNSLLGRLFETTSPAEQAAQQQTAIGQTLIPQLQAQMMGAQTPATRAQNMQLQQATTRLGQSYAASARAGGMGSPTLGGGQPTVSRAQQGRYQAAQVQGMASIMGQSQQAAQQQLGGIYQQGVGMQAAMEQQELAARGQSIASLGSFFSQLSQMKTEQAHNVQLQDFYKEFLDIMRWMTGSGTVPGASGQTTSPGSYWKPEWGRSIT